MASDWFHLLEEAVEPGVVIAAALDEAVAEADRLDLDTSCAAIFTHPDEPHGAEIEAAVEAVTRRRGEGELRDLRRDASDSQAWLHEVDDLIARLERSVAGDPATLSP